MPHVHVRRSGGLLSDIRLSSRKYVTKGAAGLPDSSSLVGGTSTRLLVSRSYSSVRITKVTWFFRPSGPYLKDARLHAVDRFSSVLNPSSSATSNIMSTYGLRSAYVSWKL